MQAGAGVPTPPLGRFCRRPEGRKERRLHELVCCENVIAPPCPVRGPEAGSTHTNSTGFTDVQYPGVNSLFMCVSPERKKTLFPDIRGRSPAPSRSPGDTKPVCQHLRTYDSLLDTQGKRYRPFIQQVFFMKLQGSIKKGIRIISSHGGPPRSRL